MALVTLPHWEVSLERLCVTAEDHLPFERVINGMLSPAFWDNEPIAFSLANAVASVPSRLRRQIVMSGAALSASDSSKSRVQRDVALHFRSALFRPDWASVFQKRLAKMFGHVSDVSIFLCLFAEIAS